MIELSNRLELYSFICFESAVWKKVRYKLMHAFVV